MRTTGQVSVEGDGAKRKGHRGLGVALALIAGLLIFVTGFLYDVMFAGIPYQDPTPELRAAYAFHSAVASFLELAGVVVALGGSALALVFQRSRG
jgi:hypothetical protein